MRGAMRECSDCGQPFPSRTSSLCESCRWRAKARLRTRPCVCCGGVAKGGAKYCKAPACQEARLSVLRGAAQNAGRASAVRRRDRRYEDLQRAEAAWRSGQYDRVPVVDLLHEVRRLRDELAVSRMGCVVVKK